MKTKKRIAILLTLCLPCMAAAEPVWKQEGDRTLELKNGNNTLVRFNLACAPLDPHFEVLATADGHNLVWVAPPDHVWHYGLWFSWKTINGVNFWETNRKTRAQQGLNVVHDPKIVSRPDALSASLSYRERSLPDPQGLAVLEDRVEIVIHKPQGDTGLQVEWRIVTMALEDVVLDRTPPPGDDSKTKGWGGYGGFSWRGAKDLHDVNFTDSEGRRGEQGVHRQRASWLSVTGLLEQRKAGLLFIPHAQNPRQPSSWYVKDLEKIPFWYVNPAILLEKPLKLAKGESIQHRYLLIVNDGDWSPERCQAEATAFAK